MTLFKKGNSLDTGKYRGITVIDSIAKFQTGLEKVDAHDHIMMPPLYRQVNT